MPNLLKTLATGGAVGRECKYTLGETLTTADDIGKEWYDLELGEGAAKSATSPFVLECLGGEEKAFWGG